MKLISYLTAAVLTIMLYCGFYFNINPQTIPKELQVGEELTYVVRYSFLKLGEIKIKITGKKNDNGEYHTAIAYINSYPNIPFVDLHQIYETKFNSKLTSNYFRGIVKYKDHSSYTEYFFDYKNNSVGIKKGKLNPPEVWTDSTANINVELQDGLSILLFARMNNGVRKTIRVPSFVNEKIEYATINFYDKIHKVSIDAVDYDIECTYLDGETDFVSIFGLTGYFEGWFSNDKYAVPILAKMKVIIGNVTLELVSWKKEGWQPPRYRR